MRESVEFQILYTISAAEEITWPELDKLYQGGTANICDVLIGLGLIQRKRSDRGFYSYQTTPRGEMLLSWHRIEDQ